MESERVNEMYAIVRGQDPFRGVGLVLRAEE